MKESSFRRNSLYFRDFKSEDDKELYIVEPGYIINKYAYIIWRMMDDEISYEDLFKRLGDILQTESNNSIHNILCNIIEQFYMRKMIYINNQIISDLQCFYSEAPTEKELLDKNKMPVTQIDLVITTECNFRCKHCFINEGNISSSQYMESAVWKEVLNKLYDYGLVSIVVTGGEPLMYKNILDVLNYANSLHMKIQLLTNAALFTEEMIKQFVQYDDLIVQVSLDGSSAESCAYQRGTDKTFGAVVDNIKRLTECGIEVIIAMVLNKKNVNDIYDNSMVRLCSELGVGFIGITPTVIETANAAENKELFLTVQEAYDAIQHLNNNKMFFKETYGVIVNVSAPPAVTEETSISQVRKVRSRCRRGTNSFSVRPNGDICVCSDFAELNFAEYQLGNLINDDFDDLISKLKEVRAKKAKSMPLLKGICSICKELPYCWGACRAAAYAKYGDIHAPYPFCQELFELGIFPKTKINELKKYKKIKDGEDDNE